MRWRRESGAHARTRGRTPAHACADGQACGQQEGREGVRGRGRGREPEGAQGKTGFPQATLDTPMRKSKEAPQVISFRVSERRLNAKTVNES
jgi:hypothetical protein